MMAGNATLDNFSAPLDTLPLFVRAGAIIPLWPLGINYFDEFPHDPMSLELWPHGNTSFTLYEDDGTLPPQSIEMATHSPLYLHTVHFDHQ